MDAPLQRRRWDPVWSGVPSLFFGSRPGVFAAIVPLVKAAQGGTTPTGNKDYSHLVRHRQGDPKAGMPLLATATLKNGEIKYMYPPTLAVLFYAPADAWLDPVGFSAGPRRPIQYGRLAWCSASGLRSC